MLSDHDRAALRSIEAELDRDVTFAASMRPERQISPPTVVFALCAMFYIAAPLAGLLFGPVGVLLAVVCLGTALVIVRIRRREPPMPGADAHGRH